MKKIITMVLCLFPCSVSAGESVEQANWVCSQPGHMNGVLVYVVSYIFIDVENHYEVKENKFKKHVNKIFKYKFEQLDDPSCRDFSSQNKAKKYLNAVLKKIKKKFKILWIDFSNLR